MKKMIITAAIVCAAIFAQAGSVLWGTVGMYDSEGSKVGSKATVYLYAITDKATYDGLTDIWAEYSNDVLNNAGASAVGGKGQKTSLSKKTIASPDGTATATTEYYAAMIVTIGTGEDMKYYAEKSSVLTGEDGSGGFNFGVETLDSAANAATAWKSATAPVTPPGPGGTDPIPEPTSGLLLMVGGALLALRRKQK